MSSSDYFSDDPVNFNRPKSKKRISGVLALIATLVVGTLYIQSTLAANISLNSGSGVEFGQGITQTVACSGATNLNITPYSTFTNASGEGAFYFSSVTVADIPVGCNGKDFSIRAYGNTSSTPLALFNTSSTNAVVWNDGGTFKVGTGGTGMSITSGSGTFTITFTSPVALASAVFKITLESGVHTYNVGDTGPAGGTIFYYSAAGFSCGPTRSTNCNFLEAASSGWNGGSDPSRRWASPTYETSAVNNASSPQTATATAIGWGYRNTRAIILQGNTDTATIAAALADFYSVSNSGVLYSDWFLPSNDELTELYNNKALVGGLFGGFDWYWSSSEASAGSALMQMIASLNAGGDDKSSPRLIRPIRAF
jgi:hypothetical protein